MSPPRALQAGPPCPRSEPRRPGPAPAAPGPAGWETLPLGRAPQAGRPCPRPGPRRPGPPAPAPGPAGRRPGARPSPLGVLGLQQAQVGLPLVADDLATREAANGDDHGGGAGATSFAARRPDARIPRIPRRFRPGAPMARGCRPGPPRAPPRGPGAAGVRLPPRRRPLRRARARGPGSGVRGPGPGPGAGPGGSPPPAPWYVPAYGVRAGPQGLGGGVRVPRARPTDSARRARGRYSAPAGPRAECGRARANWGPERRARAAFQRQVASRVWGAESGRRGRAGGGLSAWGRCPRALGGLCAESEGPSRSPPGRVARTVTVPAR